ncbi:MAG: hypothetical protein KDK60_03865, partial [Chlamydiia bacterium]|nr:hypothetical protein [Chlamydiia bacterium]
MMSYRFKKSVPLPTEGGIKLSKGKNLSSSWWKERWIEAVESFNDGGRLSRGRSYARKGQVLDISISKGQVIAIVQGSQKSPYRVSIEVETLPDEAWNMVTRALSAKALYAAKLFSGELPNDIETFFEEVGISLLPTSYSDFSTDCSCPDWSNP